MVETLYRDFQSFVLWFCLCGIAAFVFAPAAVGLWRFIRQIFSRGLANGVLLTKFVFVVCVLGAVKPDGGMNAPSRLVVWPAQVDITAEASPRADRWNVHGAAEAFAPVDFGDWVFPYGTNHVSRFAVLTSGEVRLGSMSGERLVVMSDQMSCVPGPSRFAIEALPDDSRRFRWSGFARGRDTNDLVSASLTLKRNGGWVTDADGAVTEHPRELPFEHDGFGQDADWVAANFARLQALSPSLTNAAEAISIGYPNWVARTVTENAPNGLFCLEAAFGTAPAEVTRLSVGGYSVAVAEAGIYSFVLAKGERHEIEMSFVPDDVTFSYYDGLDVQGAAPAGMRTGRGLTSRNIRTEITAAGCCDDVEMIVPSPFDPAGHITWRPALRLAPDYSIDPIYPVVFYADVDLPPGEVPTVRWTSDDGSVSVSGDMLFYYGSASVRDITVVADCRGIELTGHISISRLVTETRVSLAAPPVIVVEDPYTNRPDEVVSQTSSTVKMTASWELAEPGRLVLESAGAMATSVRVGEGSSEALTLPYEIGTFPPNERGSMDFFLTSTNMNVTGNAGAYRLRFRPDENAECVSLANVRIAKIRVEADADWPANKVRHVFGPKERFSISVVAPSGGSVKSNAGNGIGIQQMQVLIGDLDFALVFEVMKPTSITGIWLREMSDYDWMSLGLSGFEDGVAGAGFVAKWFLRPSYVSFKGLWYQEGCAPMYPKEGCFLNTTDYHPSNIGGPTVFPVQT